MDLLVRSLIRKENCISFFSKQRKRGKLNVHVCVLLIFCNYSSGKPSRNQYNEIIPSECI